MAPPRQPVEKRWAWWEQIRDAAAFVVGVGLLIYEAIRGQSDIYIVVAALACLGITGSGVATRWLERRSANGR